MTYTNKHQSKSYTFPRQSHIRIEQELTTQGLVHTSRRTTTVSPAGSPRILPLDVNTDISREPAVQPAQPKAAGHNHSSTHTRPAKRGSERDIFLNTPSRIGTSRTHTGTQIYSSGHTPGRGVQLYPEHSQPTVAPAERPRVRGVRQDKARLENARTASRQPARDTRVSRAQLTNNKVVRSQTVAGVNQKLVQVTLWVDPAVKEHLERRAREEGLTLSPAGAAFLRKAVQQDIDLQYSALLRPIIETAIARQMAGLATRLTWLLVRIAFDSGQTRSIVTNILGRQQGMTQPLLKTILEESGRSSKTNIMRRTPQISELINSVEQWMLEENRGEKAKKAV